MNGHVRRIAVWIFALLLAGGMPSPAAAGGWATVELDERPAKVVAGEPVTIGFQILSHGQMPVPGGEPMLTATHRESGERLHADGKADGAEGHYSVTVKFPTAGSWKWAISASPYPSATAFEALEVELPSLASTPAQGSVWSDRWHYPDTADQTAAPSAKNTVKITIHDGGFAPARVEIEHGTTVEWSNTGMMPHQMMGAALTFDDSNLLETGGTFAQTFDQPGTYTYVCGPHPGMVGMIVVT